MKSSEELRRQLRQIDHKGYKAYKILEGEYEFGAYRLCIDHVQGDPFATPSRVRIVYKNQKNIPEELCGEKHRKTAIEDALLRRLHRSLCSAVKGQRRGSGKSGMVTACRAGQEILERSAMHITSTVAEARIEVGFPPLEERSRRESWKHFYLMCCQKWQSVPSGQNHSCWRN